MKLRKIKRQEFLIFQTDSKNFKKVITLKMKILKIIQKLQTVHQVKLSVYIMS